MEMPKNPTLPEQDQGQEQQKRTDLLKNVQKGSSLELMLRLGQGNLNINDEFNPQDPLGSGEEIVHAITEDIMQKRVEVWQQFDQEQETEKAEWEDWTHDTKDKKWTGRKKWSEMNGEEKQAVRLQVYARNQANVVFSQIQNADALTGLSALGLNLSTVKPAEQKEAFEAFLKGDFYKDYFGQDKNCVLEILTRLKPSDPLSDYEPVRKQVESLKPFLEKLFGKEETFKTLQTLTDLTIACKKYPNVFTEEFLKDVKKEKIAVGCGGRAKDDEEKLLGYLNISPAWGQWREKWKEEEKQRKAKAPPAPEPTKLEPTKPMDISKLSVAPPPLGEKEEKPPEKSPETPLAPPPDPAGGNEKKASGGGTEGTKKKKETEETRDHDLVVREADLRLFRKIDLANPPSSTAWRNIDYTLKQLEGQKEFEGVSNELNLLIFDKFLKEVSSPTYGYLVRGLPNEISVSYEGQVLKVGLMNIGSGAFDVGGLKIDPKIERAIKVAIGGKILEVWSKTTPPPQTEHPQPKPEPPADHPTDPPGSATSEQTSQKSEELEMLSHGKFLEGVDYLEQIKNMLAEKKEDHLVKLAISADFELLDILRKIGLPEGLTMSEKTIAHIDQKHNEDDPTTAKPELVIRGELSKGMKVADFSFVFGNEDGKLILEDQSVINLTWVGKRMANQEQVNKDLLADRARMDTELKKYINNYLKENGIERSLSVISIVFKEKYPYSRSHITFEFSKTPQGTANP